MKAQISRQNLAVIITSIVAGFLLIVVNSTVWAHRYLFDTNNFTNTAVQAMTSQSSRDALAAEVVDRTLSDYPKLRSIVDDSATKFISGLLDSSRVETITTKAVSRLQVFLTSPQRQPVVLNFESAKQSIAKLIEVTGREGQTRINPDNIPDEITLFDPAKYPNFYQASVTISWLSPLLGLSIAALLGWPYIMQRARYKTVLVVQGTVLVVAGILMMLIGPLVRPMALGNIQSPNMRTFVGNIYDSFIATFNTQTWFIIAVGLLALLSVGVLRGYSWYHAKKK